MMRPWTCSFALVAVLGGAAAAQEFALPEPASVPAPTANEPDIALDLDREIDLANVVTSAAKGVTTVQEAPAIINIITSDEIKARGFRWIEDAYATVPGWMNTAALGDQAPAVPIVRGVQQSALLLRDGVSLFDPFGNNQVYHNTIPLESIKRIEIVTGPGGVLWGANSYMGIINVIMKDAQDVNGVEVSAGYGDGEGFRQDFRAYALFGKTFFDGKLRIFQHISYENYLGSTWDIPQFLSSPPAPQPTGTAFFGPSAEVNPPRSWIAIIDGKYSLGPVSLTYSIPFADLHSELTFASGVVPNNSLNAYNRHVVLEYKDRFFKNRFGLTVKGYWAQFINNFNTQLYPGQPELPAFSGPLGRNIGGLHFNFNDPASSLIQRTGLTLDADVSWNRMLRVMFGGEFFYEGVRGLTETFPSTPYASPSTAVGENGMAGVVTATPGSLPLLCPQTEDANGNFSYVPTCPRPFLVDQYRLVGALYADVQLRPVGTLVLDGGVRLQKGFGGRPYDLTPLYSGAIVWNFLPNFHLKANYTTGFRPPTFLNTDFVAGGISWAANPKLKNETSQSFQGELNARVLHNVHRIRELELRVDYSYTFLDNLILQQRGGYTNSGTRAIHSVEAYSKMYLTGDHFLTASYSFLYSQSSNVGFVKNSPSHWLSLGASFNLVRRMLDVNANLLVTGAYTDPNRYPSTGNPLPGATTAARATDITFDRLTPVALLQLGFHLRFLNERLGVSGQFYNVLNQRYYYVDGFYDTTPSEELQKNPAPGFSCFGQVSYRF